jgi:hypothetical protein
MRDPIMQTTFPVSVVICAYTEKRWQALVTAVQSVQQQTLPAGEIIVVIDRNPDLLMRVREQLTNVIVIENKEAKGASGARNSGVAIARGEIIAFLDDDAIATPCWIEDLVACYADAHVVGVGGKINPLWSESQPTWFPEEFNWVVGCSYRGMPTKNAPVRNVIGANMSVRKHALELVGGFRASFGNNKGESKASTGSKWLRHQAGDEETELCMRITQHLPDSIWLYTTAAVVQHQVPAQRARWSYFLWRCYDEGLGKATLVKLHDTATGLSAEKDYTFKVLPEGVVQGLSDVFRQHDISGLSRASAIVGGFTMTAAGYIIGSIVSAKPVPATENVRPISQHSAAQTPALEVKSPIEAHL